MNEMEGKTQIWHLQNPSGIVKYAQFTICGDNDHGMLVVGLNSPFKNKSGTYKGIQGAKIGFGIHFYTGSKWKKESETPTNQ